MKDAMRSGITSLPEVHRELGANSRAVLHEISETNALLDELGIVLDSDPRKTSNSGLNQATAAASKPAADGHPNEEEA